APADLRLVEAVNFKTDESALTGESASVHKSAGSVAPDAPLAARASIAFMGSTVTNGRARGVVVATGMKTEFGRIAELTQSVEREATPLQKDLAVLGAQLGIAAVVISAAVAALGAVMGRPAIEMLMTGVSLAVAVVPEGLPAVVTITLAVGVGAMVRRQVLLRRLQAAETLGAATVICTDKTGTLTQNEMTVTRIWLAAGAVSVSGVGYEPRGKFSDESGEIDPESRPDLNALLETGLICNHAQLIHEGGAWRKLGEPTEAAFITAARKAGLYRNDGGAVCEFSFNSVRKRMTVIVEENDAATAHVKGAPEVILDRCVSLRDGTRDRPLTEKDRTGFRREFEAMARDGLRVLAVARRPLAMGWVFHEDEVENELTLLGAVGIIDPPREETAAAIATALRAGIKVIMITGDAGETGLAIARRIGLEATRAVTGSELAEIDDTALSALLEADVIFARTAPEDKMRIVDLLQDAGEVAAMTGDGANDAPALKKSDIGIAMGIRGADVAKGAADMVLTDDNFASIINGVEEGRRQYDNIKKFAHYLLSSNVGEIVAIFTAILLERIPKSGNRFSDKMRDK
ncbi:MAG: cation-translocating P-type ATPase, partial [Parvularculaceae bacterium]